MVTLDLAILLNGLNPLTLLIISILLIAGVIWRLLVRQNKQDAVAPHQDSEQLGDFSQPQNQQGMYPQGNVQMRQPSAPQQGYQPRHEENL